MTQPVTKAVRKKAKPALRSPTWRFREFYDALGGAEKILERIESAGYAPPPIMTVRGWAHRRSIPSRWLLVLLIVGLKEEIIKDVSALDGNGAS